MSLGNHLPFSHPAPQPAPPGGPTNPATSPSPARLTPNPAAAGSAATAAARVMAEMAQSSGGGVPATSGLLGLPNASGSIPDTANGLLAALKNDPAKVAQYLNKILQGASAL